MAKFVTFIADPEVESEALRAIGAKGGELLLRGVSLDQIRELSNQFEFTLISSRKIEYQGAQIVIDRAKSQSEIEELIQPKEEKHFQFEKGSYKVTAFVGLSGGVGTTCLAIQYAFELSQKSSVQLIDLSNTNPDIAIALGLRNINSHPEKLSKNLSISEGIPKSHLASEIVFDLGCNLRSELLNYADQIFVVTRNSFNTVHRLKQLSFNPATVIFNFAERSKVQQQWRARILEEFPRMKFLNIPLDSRAFELAGERKAALIEVASNSLARKSIATLVQCESM